MGIRNISVYGVEEGMIINAQGMRLRVLKQVQGTKKRPWAWQCENIADGKKCVFDSEEWRRVAIAD